MIRPFPSYKFTNSSKEMPFACNARVNNYSMEINTTHRQGEPWRLMDKDPMKEIGF
jgi:hypothetical protein